MNYGIGEIITYHGFCKYDDCHFVTEDRDEERQAEDEILQHLIDKHGDNGE